MLDVKRWKKSAASMVGRSQSYSRAFLGVMILELHGGLSIARFCCPAAVSVIIGTTPLRRFSSQLITLPNLRTMVAQRRLSAAQLCRCVKGNPTPSTTTPTKRRDGSISMLQRSAYPPIRPISAMIAPMHLWSR